MCHDVSGLLVCIMALKGLNWKCNYAISGITRDLQSLTHSNKGDSESDLQDQTPDTDDSGAHSYPDAPTGKFFPPGATSSFKRAPIMGNRGLEQRGKKSRTYPPKDTASAQKVCIIQERCFLSIHLSNISFYRYYIHVFKIGLLWCDVMWTGM